MKLIKYLIFILIPFYCLCSCEEKENKVLCSCTFAGELSHVQYWNKYDSWDLSTIYVIIKFNDGSEQRINGNSTQIEYHFNYTSPCEMKIGSYELIIVDSYYITKTGKFRIGAKSLGNINIIEYPYSGTPQEFFDSGSFTFVFYGTIILLIFSFYIIHFIKKKKGIKVHGVQ